MYDFIDILERVQSINSVVELLVVETFIHHLMIVQILRKSLSIIQLTTSRNHPVKFGVLIPSLHMYLGNCFDHPLGLGIYRLHSLRLSANFHHPIQ